MEIKQLEYFAAAVEYGSLNRAAEKLYTTQPNVSRVLNSLEKELHVTLLERSNKGIRMTQQGEELYGHAMSILKHSNVIRSMSERPNGRRFSVSGYRERITHKAYGAAVSKLRRTVEIRIPGRNRGGDHGQCGIEDF